MNIKILGTGCPKCKKLEEVARAAAEAAGVAATFEHVTDINTIMEYVSMTPGLVIDGGVKSSGRVPSKSEIAAWIQEGTA